MKNVARVENGKALTRLGIRCEYIKISREKISNQSFQLPIYAIVHEAESSLVTFQLKKDTFFYGRARQEVGFNEYQTADNVWLEFDQHNMFFFAKTLELISTS